MRVINLWQYAFFRIFMPEKEKHLQESLKNRAIWGDYKKILVFKIKSMETPTARLFSVHGNILK